LQQTDGVSEVPHLGDRELNQAALMADVEAVRQYGQAHPDAWVQMKFENEPEVRAVVLISGDDVAGHERALRQLVQHPDRLEVERSAWPLAYLEEIRAELQKMMTDQPGSVQGLGLDWGTVGVRLRADQEPLAQQLHGRYGAAVRLTVGALPFPAGRPLTLREQRLQQLLQQPRAIVPEVSIPGLAANLELTAAVVVAGQNGSGHVMLRNAGDARLELRSEQPLVGRVVSPGTRESVGGFAGNIAGTGLRIRLEPGDQYRIGLVFGTASNRDGLGYVIAPGRYLVQTEVPIYDSGPEPGRRRRVLPVPPAELTIVGS
jgi:hypothetical protein